MRREQPPRIALVRLRKRDEWVLPKGRLDEGETPRTAARREVLEETGHNVTVQEFLGTLVYDSGGRSRVVHYWRMEAGSEQVRELMHDVRAVEWLPLEAAGTMPQLPLDEPAPSVSAVEQEIVLSPPDPETVQAGDGEAMPPRHQRASFAERVRNWLGRDA